MATLYPVRDATAGYIPVIFNYLLCQRKASRRTRPLVFTLEFLPASVIGLSADAREFLDKVHFPRFAAIFREGLLKMAGVRANIRPDMTNEDWPAMPSVWPIEFAVTLFELSRQRRIHAAVVAVAIVETPLMSLWIV